MKKAVVPVVFMVVFLLLSGPSCSEEAKTPTKAVILEGLKVIRGFQGGQQARPDLVVEKIWLDDACQINVRIKNIGSGAIPDAEYGRAVMRISSGQQFKEYPYAKGSLTGQPPVDAGRTLQAPGGSVDFNTGIKIDRALNVSVFADPLRSIRESNEGNNRKTENLNPQCSRQVQTTDKDSPSTPSEKTEPVPSAQEAAEEVVIQDQNESEKTASGQPGADSNR